MNETFTRPIIVCTSYYAQVNNPVVIRVRNYVDGGNTFEMSLVSLRPDQRLIAPVQVDCFTTEAGVYTLEEHGIRFEARRYVSTYTNSINNWSGAYDFVPVNKYDNAVVLGQVMTEFNYLWTSFYSRGYDGSKVVIGKQGPVQNEYRSVEILGVIVMEAKTEYTGIWRGRTYQAIPAGPVIRGVSDTPVAGFRTSDHITPTLGVNTISSMNDESQGGFSVWFGRPNVALAGDINVAISAGNAPNRLPESAGILIFE
jgi:hypothetical protein